MPKPFNPRELLARIKAVLRRQTSESEEVVQSNGLKMRISRREVFLEDEEVEADHY